MLSGASFPASMLLATSNAPAEAPDLLLTLTNSHTIFEPSFHACVLCALRKDARATEASADGDKPYVIGIDGR